MIDKINHEELFSGTSLKLGIMNWYIQKADSEMEKRAYVQHEKKEPLNINPIEITAFGKEVVGKEIHWWVFEKERNVDELKTRTTYALEAAQSLKEASVLLRKHHPETYPKLILELKDYTIRHEKDIDILHEYVKWLFSKDVLAPAILFTYEVWGSTRLSDKTIKIISDRIEEDIEHVQRCVEGALGLRVRDEPVYYRVYFDIEGSIADSTDPEFHSKIFVPERRLINETTEKVLEELAIYFEFIRNALRKILLTISYYQAEADLLFSESFWRDFIRIAMKRPIETQLWDFKQTFEMWNTQGQVKEDTEFEFCKNVAAFANKNGGTLLVGITDQIPRQIIGLDNLESKVQSIKTILNRHLNRNSDFIHLQVVPMLDERQVKKNCLVIAIAQTKDVIFIKDQAGRITYPKREETGLEPADPQDLTVTKSSVYKDNYFYLSTYKRILREESPPHS